MSIKFSLGISHNIFIQRVLDYFNPFYVWNDIEFEIFLKQ